MGHFDPCHSNFSKLDLMLKIMPLSGMILNVTPNFTELWWHESNFPFFYQVRFQLVSNLGGFCQMLSTPPFPGFLLAGLESCHFGQSVPRSRDSPFLLRVSVATYPANLPAAGLGCSSAEKLSRLPAAAYSAGLGVARASSFLRRNSLCRRSLLCWLDAIPSNSAKSLL